MIKINFKNLNAVNKQIGVVLKSGDMGNKFVPVGTPVFIEKEYKTKYFVSIPDNNTIFYATFNKDNVSLVKDEKLKNLVLDRFINNGVNEVLFYKFNIIEDNTIKTA